jgi:hypothetical protein
VCLYTNFAITIVRVVRIILCSESPKCLQRNYYMVFCVIHFRAYDQYIYVANQNELTHNNTYAQ